jgi:hypothetical protein
MVNMLACKKTAEIVQLRGSGESWMCRVAATPARPGQERAASKTGPGFGKFLFYGQWELYEPGQSRAASLKRARASDNETKHDSRAVHVRLCVAVGVSLPWGDWVRSRAEVTKLRLPDGHGFGR